LVKASHDPRATLRLWQRSTVMYCALLFPMFCVLFHYSELFITTLFTSKFLPALPVFSVYLFWIVRRCFAFDELLRTLGRTGFMIKGSLIGFGADVLLAFLLYQQLGFIGPAVASVVSELIAELYYAHLGGRAFAVRSAELLDWRGIGRVVAGCLAGLPVLLAADHVPAPAIIRAAMASLLFVLICWYVAFLLGVDDIGRAARLARSWIHRPR